MQVFLVTTFTSGAAAVASQIVSNPTQAVPLLSQNLPKASNFYISYFVLYGVANAARYLFNMIGLLKAVVLNKLAKTPRKKYEHYVAFAEPSWGAEYPKWTNLGVIALSYAVIAPLVLGFATVEIGLIYLSYRYNMLYALDTHVDTKGGFYARALQQLMVGVYLGELCLLGLFGLNIGNSVVSAGPTVMQGVLIIATVIFHILMLRKLKHVDLTSHPNNFDQRDAEAAHPVEQTAAPHEGSDSEMSDQALVSGLSRRNVSRHNSALAPPNNTQPKRSLVQRTFSPHTLSADQLSASLDRRFNTPVSPYTRQEILEAFLHPALAQRQKVIWLARDAAGVSKYEVAQLIEVLGRHGVECTDECAFMDENGKVSWNPETVRQVPLWEEPVVY